MPRGVSAGRFASHAFGVRLPHLRAIRVPEALEQHRAAASGRRAAVPRLEHPACLGEFLGQRPRAACASMAASSAGLTRSASRRRVSYFKRVRSSTENFAARLDHVERQLRPQRQLAALEVGGIPRRIQRLPQRHVPRRVVGVLDVPAGRVQHLRQIAGRMQVLPDVLLRAARHVEVVVRAILHALRNPRVPQVEDVAVRVRIGVVRFRREPASTSPSCSP